MKRHTAGKIGALGLFGAVAVVASFQAGTFYQTKKTMSVGETSVAREESATLVPAAGDDNLRVTSQTDGSRVVWIRGADKREISKYDFAADGSLVFRTVFRIDANGDPLDGKIFDDRSRQVFKASYGYRRSDGTLAEERLFPVNEAGEAAGENRTSAVRQLVFNDDADGKKQVSVIPGDGGAKLAMNRLPSPFVELPFGVGGN